MDTESVIQTLGGVERLSKALWINHRLKIKLTTWNIYTIDIVEYILYIIIQ